MKGGVSGWLTILPLHEEGYDMSATQFQGQLAIQYHHEPSGLPASCDGCGAPFSLQHGLDCAKGGLVNKGHNDLRDIDARIADVVWGGVAIEPILVPENNKKGRPMLQAGWMVRGVWEGNRVAFFNNHIIDADAPSYARANLSWESVSARVASARKSKYCLATEELRGSFTRWRVPRMVCYTENMLPTRNGWHVISPRSGRNHFQLSWHGSAFIRNLQYFGQWTFDYVVPVGGSGVSACKTVQPSELDTSVIVMLLTYLNIFSIISSWFIICLFF